MSLQWRTSLPNGGQADVFPMELQFLLAVEELHSHAADGDLHSVLAIDEVLLLTPMDADVLKFKSGRSIDEGGGG